MSIPMKKNRKVKKSNINKKSKIYIIYASKMLY